MAESGKTIKVGEIRKQYIDWDKTSKCLRMLRLDNRNLRRYVCYKLKAEENNCRAEDCDNCTFDMDSSISQKELAAVFNVSESVVVNWESGKTNPPLEELMFYAQICGLTLDDIIVMQ